MHAATSDFDASLERWESTQASGDYRIVMLGRDPVVHPGRAPEMVRWDAALRSERPARFPSWLQDLEATDRAAVARGGALYSRFRELRTRWLADTRFLSSQQAIVSDPSYLRIIGMGPAVLPLILKDMESAEDQKFWFAALSAIANEDPVNPDDRGSLQSMTQAWLKWGRSRRLI
jgi:hypothetical protein